MKKVFLAIVALAAVALVSCQKDSSLSDSKLTTTDALQVAVDGDQASGMYAEVGSEVDQAMSTLKAGGEMPDSTGKRNFEDYSKDRKDGCIMKRILFAKWGVGVNKRWIKNGSIVYILSPDKLTDTIKFVGLTINGKRIEGTRVTSRSADGNTKVVKLIGGKITFKDSTTYTVDFTETWTRTAGSDTPHFIWDDEWNIVKSATGVNRKKLTYTEETTIPLHLKVLWPVFVSGEVKRVVGDHTIITNYGDGANDFIVTVTVDGVAKTIDLSQEDKE